MPDQKTPGTGAKGAARIIAGLLIISSILIFGPRAEAQFTSGSTAAQGDFANPLTIPNPGGGTCTYDLLRFDMLQGKVFVRPTVRTDVGRVNCATTAMTEVTAQSFTNPPASGFADGIVDVANFNLRMGSGYPDPCCIGLLDMPLTVEIIPNAINTPLIIRATGNISVGPNVTLKIDGQQGGTAVGLLRGQGGAGGPGGFRGGDGGNGGAFASNGSPGLGPAGGLGQVVGQGSQPGAGFLTTGVTVAGRVIPPGNDLLTLLRGGSGGGGGAGGGSLGGDAGGGGGGALLLVATGSITVNGAITAYGGSSGCCSNGDGNRGNGGSGGVLRLVGTSVTGTGSLSVLGGGCGGCFSPTAANGLIRIESFNTSFTGSLSGNVTASPAPGRIVLPSDPQRLFIRLTSVTDTNNPSNTVTIANASQAVPGQTGGLNPTTFSMPNPTGIAPTSVTMNFEVGPNPGFPAGKTLTVVVTPLDSAAGTAQTYTSSAVACSTTCTASVTGAALPPGVGSITAFTVLSLSSSGTLSRSFPALYEDEPIESVRIQSNGRGTEYVLISKNGREFPYKTQDNQ